MAKNCEKCGKELQDAAVFCPACGANANGVNMAGQGQPTANVYNGAQYYPTNSKLSNMSVNKKLAFAFWGIAIVVLLLSLVAAGSILSGGSEIADIRSVGGQTLDEAYYQELGSVYAGYAGIVSAMGIFMSSILGFLGFYFKTKEN